MYFWGKYWRSTNHVTTTCQQDQTFVRTLHKALSIRLRYPIPWVCKTNHAMPSVPEKYILPQCDGRNSLFTQSAPSLISSSQSEDTMHTSYSQLHIMFHLRRKSVQCDHKFDLLSVFQCRPHQSMEPLRESHICSALHPLYSYQMSAKGEGRGHFVFGICLPFPYPFKS